VLGSGGHGGNARRNASAAPAQRIGNIRGKIAKTATEMNILVTGSNGLIGSAAVEHFDRQGHRIAGVDNNMRRNFFGAQGDTTWTLDRLRATTKHLTHYDLDIRNREAVFDLFRKIRFDRVVHCAAQPSHDKAAEIPLVDFDVNAVGTLNLLEATRQLSPEATFLFMSTNKVYGDAPNELPLKELATRYDYADSASFEGIAEDLRIDRSLHSIFGASKVAADVMAQEYGRYYGLAVGVFRGGCLTGPNHSGVRLHGFLSYLVRVAYSGETYTIHGYRGKQVRDNLHSHDVITAMESFAAAPRPGEVYNLGGGRANSISVIEAIERIEQLSGRKIRHVYEDQPRKGDHICYISDVRKLKSHFPSWEITRSLDAILKEMVFAEGEHHRSAGSFARS
jgi:CDP-paratose 2-epimerase